MINDQISKAVNGFCGQKIELESFGRFGDFSISPGNVQKLIDKKRVNGDALAREIFSEFEINFPKSVEKVEFVAGYINIYLSKEAYLAELVEFLDDPSCYFIQSINQDKTIVFDYSQPNIAKPFSVGHLRSTIIGQANLNIHRALGYQTVGINHIGDWGTQFGKLIYAVKTWGNEEEIEKNPIGELTRLYVQFHERAETDKDLDHQARRWFKKLEDGDEEARRLWKKCVEWSFEEFGRIYKILNVSIDNVTGESFYENHLSGIVSEIRQKGLLKESEGAKIVELDGMPPALIQKSDGASLYITRDLAAVKYRLETYKPKQIIYHVGNDQALHFKQLVAVCEKLGWLKQFNAEIVFAPHGMMRLPEGKMSTRKGRVVLLNDLIEEATARSLKIIREKDSDLENKEEVAQEIGVSAIKYADLSQNRKSDIVFSFDKFITLDGNSGPYMQYVYARTIQLLEKFSKTYPNTQEIAFLPDEAHELSKLILKTKSVLVSAALNSTPNLLCEHLRALATEFNNFYESKKIITEDETESAQNIYIVKIASEAIGFIFDLLGLQKLPKI